MIKFVSELKGKPVILRQEKAIVGIVEDVIVNPDDGKVAGLLIREGFGKNHLKALPEKDLLNVNTEFFLITSYEALGDLEDIVRLRSIAERQIPIVKTKTYTVSGKYLGKSRDYSINLKTMKIDKIYIDPALFSGVIREYAIAFPQIVSIEKDKITVEDASIKVKKTVGGRLAEPAS